MKKPPAIAPARHCFSFVPRECLVAFLPLAFALVASTAHAWESLDDEGMGAVTGEGIAFLPEDSLLLFRKAGANEAASTLLSSRSNDTGYLRFIPVGPLTAKATGDSTYGPTTGKGDIFLYGLALSKGNGDFNSRLDATNPYIRSWGTAANPWLLKVNSEAAVPDFSPSGSGTVSYLALQAPLHNETVPTDPLLGADAYNLKLAYWLDAFVRRPDVAEDMTATGTQFDVGGAGRANRLRLQAIWNDLSLNGSQVQLFQTLGGATASATNGNATNTFYNNTLGVAAVLRLNSSDTTGLRAATSLVAGSRTVEAYTLTWDGARYGTVANYTDTSGTSGGASSPACSASNSTHRAAGTSCTTRFQTRAINDAASSGSWQAPSMGGVGGLRFSTRETGTGQGRLETPAINGVGAPDFDGGEGLYFYGLNLNLVLGTLYQPLIVGKDAGSSNLILEVAAIPNKPALYQKIYTRYDNDAGGSSFAGSSCSIHACGTGTVTGYQGAVATHSSISIGSTVWDSATKSLYAYRGVEAVGVSFGALPTAAQSRSTAAASYRDVQRATRTHNSSWSGDTWNAWGAWSTLAEGASANYNLAAHSPNTWTQKAAPPPPNFVTSVDEFIPGNNLGSVVIDGLLLQHLKITTKGL
jgi:hypothetical protein